MQPSEADEFAGRCKGNYPRMTDTQYAAVKALVATHDRSLAGKALAEFVQRVSDWDTAQFMAVLNRVTIQANPSQRVDDAKARHLKFLADVERQRAAQRREESRVDAMLASRDPAEIDRRAEEVLSSMTSGPVTDRARQKGWRNSILLRGAIARQIDIENGDVVIETDRKSQAAGEGGAA